MSNPSPRRPVPSPCVKICMLDPATNRCIGCDRTIEEIATWGQRTAEDGDDEESAR